MLYINVVKWILAKCIWFLHVLIVMDKMTRYNNLIMYNLTTSHITWLIEPNGEFKIGLHYNICQTLREISSFYLKSSFDEMETLN
jgi:hypothetical protein